MLGAVIGDLAIATWETDQDKFYSMLVSETARPSMLGRAVLNAANASLLGGKETSADMLASRGTLEYYVEGLLYQSVACYMGLDQPRYFPSSFAGNKEYGYASRFVRTLLVRLLEGATKSEAYHADKTFVKMSKSNCYMHPAYFGPMAAVMKAWDCFYRGFDFTSCLHNAARCQTKHRQAIAALTGMFASAMYGCGYGFIKKKYAYGGNAVIGLSETLRHIVAQCGYPSHLINKMYRTSHATRAFYPKNEALTNVERHQFAPIYNLYEEVTFDDYERKRIMRSCETSFDCRYGFYLDDGWHYVYRGCRLIGRFKLAFHDKGWHITDTQLSGERPFRDFFIAISCALYEGCGFRGEKSGSQIEVLNYLNYYNGEKECPEEWKKSVNSKFWWGEMMFVTTRQSLSQWSEYAVSTRKGLEDDKKVFAVKYNDNQLGIILYIETLFGKMCPYEDMQWIYQYKISQHI